MNAAAPVDELLLDTLERFTRRVPDAPFGERWRTAVVLLEQDLATGPRAEHEADALDAPHMRDRLNAVTDRWRSLLREALDEHGLGRSERLQFGNGLLLERLLGLDRGHAGLLAAIDNWLTSWEAP
jgi:hypothetical protein